MDINQKCGIVLEDLIQMYPDPKSELEYSSAFQLLIAVMLSAQCTDKRVNQTTPELFVCYPTPKEMSMANVVDVEKIIYKCGLYHNKAKNIVNCSKELVDRFNGEVPSNLDDLQSLPGVGRKTANLVYALFYHGDAIAVDTHVYRVSKRLGIADGKNPLEVERSLMTNFNKDEWANLHFRLVLFGRYKCKARSPECGDCKMREICSYYKKIR